MLMRVTEDTGRGVDPCHGHRERGAMAYVTSVHAEWRSRVVPADEGRRARVTVPLDERQY